MVSITVSAAGHPPSLARGLPLKAEIPGKDIENATIGDIKSAVAAKFPKVRQRIHVSSRYVFTSCANSSMYRGKRSL
jgi:hypothetical protein